MDWLSAQLDYSDKTRSPGFPEGPLKRPIAKNTQSDPDDVLGVKTFLHKAGLYDKPDYGMTPYPDQEMFSAIKAFQSERGLEVDGVMKPDGETQIAMRKTSQEQPEEAVQHPPEKTSLRFSLPEINKTKDQFFDDDLKEKRVIFNDALNKVEGLSATRHRAYLTTYEMEGGDQPDGSTMSGITQTTLNDLKKDGFLKDIPKGAKPADLSAYERAQVYEEYAERALGRVGGKAVLDKMDPVFAAVTYDTLIRHGESGGSIVIRKALNATRGPDEPELDTGPGRIGEATLERLIGTMNGEKRKQFLQALAGERMKEYPTEGKRFNYYVEE